MAIIQIFHPETYPKEVVEVRRQLMFLPENIKEELLNAKYLSDYTSSSMWEIDKPFGELHRLLMSVLEPHEIVAYHNTRLADKKCIFENGLIFSDNRYIENIRNTLEKQGIGYGLINEVVEIIKHERDRWAVGNQNRRKNEVCFIYDMDYYKDYNKFLTVFGGEFMEFGLTSHTGNKGLSKYRQVIKVGSPYVIEFSIPYMWFTEFERQDIARYMLEEWIHIDIRKDNPQHQYDGRIEKEIPPEKIIEIHEVEDAFPDMDEWLFRN